MKISVKALCVVFLLTPINTFAENNSEETVPDCFVEITSDVVDVDQVAFGRVTAPEEGPGRLSRFITDSRSCFQYIRVESVLLNIVNIKYFGEDSTVAQARGGIAKYVDASGTHECGFTFNLERNNSLTTDDRNFLMTMLPVLVSAEEDTAEVVLEAAEETVERYSTHERLRRIIDSISTLQCTGTPIS